ncbi:uncharacterized protein N7483_008649 [Penicillium malachiteum]|uniref:uncharacterized protein n=1 Tax=Penicillium malachiteum TaxID=1324776 RepID=UPI0025477F91|nr:uncharacterized protein N7483_008649 [Penicillium malachiteum]KAJ5720715.1 hypothetical protein N7483_008649 [Penicillium malachiteum]
MSIHDQFPAYGGRGPSDLRLGIALGTIATIFMIMRVYVRLRMNKFGTTALLLSLLAWFFTAITQVFGILSVLHGLGNHITIIEEVGQLHNFLLFTWITVFFFNLAIPTGKVAVAAFLIEMNGPSNPKIRRSLIAVAVLNIVLNIPQLLMVWFQCSPVDSLWDPLKQADCDHRKSVYYTYLVGAIAALSDFYLAIVPIHMLIPLRIDRKLKWGLSFLMGCGIFAGVAAIVRTWAAKYILEADSSCKTISNSQCVITILTQSQGVLVYFSDGVKLRNGSSSLPCRSPPVWPIFRPFTNRFITSAYPSQPQYAYKNNNPYGSQQLYGSTAVASPLSPSFPPPLVTTTISISSMKGGETSTFVPSESSPRNSNERTPHNIITDNKNTLWVELQEVNFKRSP